MRAQTGFMERRIELRTLILSVGLVIGVMFLTELGLAERFAEDPDLYQATWGQVIFWYAGLFIFASWALSRLRQKPDQRLLPVVATLGGVSLALIYRIFPDLLVTQAIWFALGLLVMCMVIYWPNLLTWLRHHRRIVFVAGIALLLITAAFGQSPATGGPKINLVLGPLNLQPAELIKLIFVIYLASYLAENRDRMNRLTIRQFGLRLPLLPTIAPMIMVLGLALGSLVLMSDLGAALILIGTFPILIFLALDWKVVWKLVVMTMFGFYVFSSFATSDTFTRLTGVSFIESGINRVEHRVKVWEDPWACVQSTECDSYQTLQTLYAVAAGGLWGMGPGQGLASDWMDVGSGYYYHRMPAAHTDMIFAVWVEEWGFLGGTLVLALYGLLVYRGLRIARRQTFAFERLLAAGIATIFALQTMVIVGGTLNLLPLTGITVPFLSYGGTSILMNFVMVGLLLRISAQPSYQVATNGSQSRLNLVTGFYAFGLVALVISLGYWTTYKSGQLAPSFPDAGASVNYVAAQRYAAWLERVERGQILAADGTILARNAEAVTENSAPRWYSDATVAHTVGQVNEQGLGINGLEASYNDVLLGQGRYDLPTLWARQTDGSWEGNDLQLTLDPRWQASVSRNLGGFSGAAVVLDAETGAVLAMVSHPLYNPNNPAASDSDSRQPLLNRAVQGLYPPGSTFKVPVAALALRENLVKPDTVFDYTETDEWYWVGESLCHQRYIGGGLISSCNTYLQEMTLSEGLAWSDNLVFADLAGELGAEEMWAGAEDFGFGEVLDFDLPVLTSTLAQSPDRLNDPAQLAMTGFGQSEVSATPLQMALVAASIANDGKMPRPYVVDQVLRPDGSTLRQTRPDTWQKPLGRGDARRTAEMMVAAVEDGWASGAAVPGFTVGGKTGTAEWSGTARGLRPHSWFIGFIEMSDGQKVAIAIIAEQGGDGGAVAAPMAGRIFGEMSQ